MYPLTTPSKNPFDICKLAETGAGCRTSDDGTHVEPQGLHCCDAIGEFRLERKVDLMWGCEDRGGFERVTAEGAGEVRGAVLIDV